MVDAASCRLILILRLFVRQDTASIDSYIEISTASTTRGTSLTLTS